MLFVFGGFGGPGGGKAPGGGVALASVVSVDLTAPAGTVKQRRNLPAGPTTNLACDAVPSAGAVVCAGGYVYPHTNNSVTARVWLYTPASDTYRELARMRSRRGGFGLTLVAAPLQLQLFATGASAAGLTRGSSGAAFTLLAVGGFAKDPVTGFHPLNSTEFYDSASDRWVPGPNMPSARAQVQLAAVTRRGNSGPDATTLYVLGGSNATADICYKELNILERSVLALDLGNLACGLGQRSNTGNATDAQPGRASPHVHVPCHGWTRASQLPTPRGFLAAAAVGRTIYTLGGYNGTHDTNCVETFNVDNKLWRRCTGVHV